MSMNEIVRRLRQDGIRATKRNGMYRVRLSELGAILKLGEIDDPGSYARAEAGDKYVVRKEGLHGNEWAEYFAEVDDVVQFVQEKDTS